MTYVFQCRSCGHEFEMTATVAEYESRKRTACPECGHGNTRRVYTPILVMTAARGGGDDTSSSGGCGCGGACSCGH